MLYYLKIYLNKYNFYVLLMYIVYIYLCFSFSAGIICYCNNCPGNRDAENGTCPLAFGGQCFSAIEQVYFKEDNSYENVRTFGCFSASDQALLQCRGDLVPSYNLRSIQCCNFTDLCNQNLLPQLKIRNIIPPPNIFMQSNIHLLTLLLSFIFGFIIIFAYIAFAYKRYVL